MEETLELVRHGSFSLFLAFVISMISYIAWKVWAPGVEAAWLFGPLAVLLVVIVCLPNGMDWLFDIRHVDLEATEEDEPRFSLSLLLIADALGTALGALAGVLLGSKLKGRP